MLFGTFITHITAEPAGEMNGSWELDFYRKYNENSPQVRYYQQTLLPLHQPLCAMYFVIEQIISLLGSSPGLSAYILHVLG